MEAWLLVKSIKDDAIFMFWLSNEMYGYIFFRRTTSRLTSKNFYRVSLKFKVYGGTSRCEFTLWNLVRSTSTEFYRISHGKVSNSNVLIPKTKHSTWVTPVPGSQFDRQIRVSIRDMLAPTGRRPGSPRTWTRVCFGPTLEPPFSPKFPYFWKYPSFSTN